ncbi:MAG: minor capsid protein [Eubacteriales bacterium]|nr:minor capsid protein [Eubacteriales bacterium]
MTSRDYWEMRARQAQMDEYLYSEDAYRYISGVMDETKEKIWEKLLYYLSRISGETGLSFERLKEKLTAGELEHYRMSLEEYIKLAESAVTKADMHRLNMASHMHGIDRLTAMAEEINRYTHEAYLKYQNHLGKFLEDSFEREWERIGEEIGNQKTLLLEDKAVPQKPEAPKSKVPKPKAQKPDAPLKIDKRKMNQILKEPWASDKNFSDNIWQDKQRLADELRKELTQATITGEKLENVEKRIADKFDTHKKAARRLVHTENAYATSKARQERYKEDGVEKYQYIATLDLKTSKPCRGLDKKVFQTVDYAVGTTAPPMHPHCRSTTVAYYGMESSTRMARNPVTGKSEKVDNMNYQEWYDKYVKGNPEAEAREKMWQNRYQDDKQYQRYQAVLGKNAPKTLEEFQKMKYIKPEDFEELKQDFDVHKAIEKNAKITDKARAKDLYRRFRENGVYASDHFIEQFINREHDKKGNQVFTFEEIAEIAKKKPNYKDEKNGREITIDNGISIIKEEGKAITLRKGRLSKRWKKI